MNVKLIEIDGNWDLGYVLDKQMESSTFLGNDENGRPKFDNVRTEIGEAAYQLKYHNDFSKINPLAKLVAKHLGTKYKTANIVIPMPFSKPRPRQPVLELANEISKQLGASYRDDILVKNGTTSQMKDIKLREEKLEALKGCFEVKHVLDKVHDIIIVDDIFDSGSSLEVACDILRGYDKINKIYVVALTRTKRI